MLEWNDRNCACYPKISTVRVDLIVRTQIRAALRGMFSLENRHLLRGQEKLQEAKEAGKLLPDFGEEYLADRLVAIEQNMEEFAKELNAERLAPRSPDGARN